LKELKDPEILSAQIKIYEHSYQNTFYSINQNGAKASRGLRKDGINARTDVITCAMK
jgi:hypothetical protein